MCVSCGRKIDFAANVCPYCGHDYRMQSYLPPPQRSSKPLAGGILILIAGILAIGMGVLYLTLSAADLEAAGVVPTGDISLQDVQNVLVVCGIILIMFGLVAVLGGVFGIQRKHFGLTIVGGILGLLGIGFLLGAILALVGIILIAVSRNEFS